MVGNLQGQEACFGSVSDAKSTPGIFHKREIKSLELQQEENHPFTQRTPGAVPVMLYEALSSDLWFPQQSRSFSFQAGAPAAPHYSFRIEVPLALYRNGESMFSQGQVFNVWPKLALLGGSACFLDYQREKKGTNGEGDVDGSYCSSTACYVQAGLLACCMDSHIYSRSFLSLKRNDADSQSTVQCLEKARRAGGRRPPDVQAGGAVLLLEFPLESG